MSSSPAMDAEFRRDTSFQLTVATQQFIQQSPRYLISGTALGVLGFLVAVIPYLMRALHLLRTGKLTRYDVPPTVSELVSRWDTVEARIFFGFELMAALLILMSEYPFKIRGASCVPSAGGCSIRAPFIGEVCSWATFRNIVPPVGLTLVALCPTVKIERGKAITPADAVLIIVHCAAAAMVFMGFLLAEGHMLGVNMPLTRWAPLCCPKSEAAVNFMIPRDREIWYCERRWRKRTWRVALWCFVLFQVMTVFLLFYTGPRRRFNVISFLLEVIAGIAMLWNHGIIWYFCRERHWGMLLARNRITSDTSQAIELASAEQ